MRYPLAPSIRPPLMHSWHDTRKILIGQLRHSKKMAMMPVMRQIATAIFMLALAVGLIAFAFTIQQTNREEERLAIDLERRSILLAENIRESVETNFLNRSDAYLQNAVKKFAERERIAGLTIYSNEAAVVARSSQTPLVLPESQRIAATAMDKDAAHGEFATADNKRIYLLALPIHEQDSVIGALLVAQRADYIDARLAEIWRNNLIRLLLQVLLITFAVLLMIRWLIYAPVRNLVASLKSARMENNSSEMGSPSGILQPLATEIKNIRRSLMEARIAAREEAEVNLEKLDSPWTADRLHVFTEQLLKERPLIVVSNAEPYTHTKDGSDITYFTAASGVNTALDPIMQACGGTWIAYGPSEEDKLVVDSEDKIQVPPNDPKYTLRRVWLSPEEWQGYYAGVSTEGLWALFHNAHTRPIFRKEDWLEYKKVNGKFAEAVLTEIKNVRRPIVFIQDFGFTILPRLIRRARPDATIGVFWHIPWVSPETFSTCPWKKEILNGILNADLIGFHTQLYCNNFIESVGREMETRIDFERFAIVNDGHTTLIKPFPISIAFSNGSQRDAEGAASAREANAKLLKSMGTDSEYIGVGVDRLDYMKGVLERIKAIEIFLRKYPEYVGRFSLIQIAAPTRTGIKKYREFAKEVEDEVLRVNALFGSKKWTPIVLLKRHHSHEEIEQFYRIADFCLVTSLHDGMNLVAKEFVAARDDEKGVLVLSQFTGASRELKDALIINPYDGAETAEAIHAALTMSPVEQTKRMKNMRETVRNYNVYRWAAEIIKTLSGI